MVLEKREFELLMLCLSLTLIFSGILLQYKVIVSNGCRMPVPLSMNNYYDIDNGHIFYEDIKGANYYLLSDI